MKKTTQHVKQHKKAHHRNVRRPTSSSKGKSRSRNARLGHASHKRVRLGHASQKSVRRNHGMSLFPKAITVLASTAVGVGILSLLVARTGIDTIKKTLSSFY